MRNETQRFEKDIIKFKGSVGDLVVKNDSDLEKASVLLTSINKVLGSIEGEKNKVLKPLNEAVKAERARWKPIETVYEDMVAGIRSKMSIYQTDKFNKAKIDARGIADLMGKGKFTVESVQDKLAQIEQPKKKVAKVSFREDRVLKIVDESKIPRKYLVIDKTAVKDDLKNGIDVPGAILETVLVPVDLG